MRTTLTKIINYTVHAADPESIILFGSYAKAQDTIHSDIDLLVITNNAYNRKTIEREIISFAKECSMKADVKICTPLEASNAQNNPTGFLHSILKEGKIIFRKKDRADQTLYRIGG